MAVVVKTSSARRLLRQIYLEIDTERIRFWRKDEDGDLSYTAPKWDLSAWFRPRISDDGALVFNIVAPSRDALSKEVYGVYHGRLIEMLLVHFDDEFEKVQATALPLPSDFV